VQGFKYFNLCLSENIQQSKVLSSAQGKTETAKKRGLQESRGEAGGLLGALGDAWDDLGLKQYFSHDQSV